jgi:hypothetical protein
MKLNNLYLATASTHKEEPDKAPPKNRRLQILIVVLSMIAGSLLPFPEFISIGFAVFCVVNVLQTILFMRYKLYWMALLSVYFLGLDIFGVFNNWRTLSIL